MNTALLENPDRTVFPSRREVELSALVEKLLGEVSQLRGEVAELRQQVGYWKGMFEQAKRKNEKLEKEIDSLRAENRQLKDRLFAAKSEKKPPKDRSNGLGDPKTAKEPRRPRGQQRDTLGSQRRAFLSSGGRDPLVGIRRAGGQNRLPLVALGVLERRHDRDSS